MSARVWTIIGLFSVSIGAGRAVADEVLYRYEGNVPPYHESAGWWFADYCEDECTDAVEDGHYVLHWTHASNEVNYHYEIARPPAPPPPLPLWVEWRFRSNHPIGPYFYTCDARFAINYARMHEVVYMYGDAAMSYGADVFVVGLAIEDFHTYRFETIDGIFYNTSVDGDVFGLGFGYHPIGVSYLQFGGAGGCLGDDIPNMLNEWDFIRFGTISYGERIVASDPPSGFLDARQHAGLDRFTVTFDESNYVYLDEITVEVTGGGTPEVTQTRRRDNGEPDTVEIVLDRPIAFGESVRFTFDDGAAVNVVEYTFAPGDTDGDGDADLHDFALFQICFGQSNLTGPCAALDLHPDDTIDLADYALFRDIVVGQ